jgi:hypothetical protein
VEENGKYYVVIAETGEDSYGMITINLSEKEHIGYQSGPDLVEHVNYKANNYWSIVQSEIANTKAKTRLSRKIIIPDSE